MTFEEAIGIKSADIDIATGKRVTHEEKYGRMMEYLGGLDVLIPLIPFDKARIKKEYARDKHLNGTSIKKWDAAAGFFCSGPDARPIGGPIWDLYRSKGITSASCAQGVCLLKHAAREWLKRPDGPVDKP